MPKALIFLILLAASPGLPALVITEIQYHSNRRLAGGLEDKDYEFIEFYNENRDPLDLSGHYFSKGIGFEFPPGTWLEGLKYLVVCRNPDKIRSAYGITNTIGPWSATNALDNSGETLALSNPGGAEVLRVSYNDRGKWPAGADGTGHTLVLKDPYLELDDPDHWTLSRDRGGSPGRAEPSFTPLAIRLNEGLLRTAGSRFIELYNQGSSAGNLAGYHITTDRLRLDQATIAAGASLAPRGWLALSEVDLGISLALPPGEDRLFVALADPEGTRVLEAFIFRPQVDGKSEARIPDGGGDFEEAADPTPGAANRATVETDVIIDEIMYHPLSDDPRDEYVEIHNRGAAAVDLGGWSFVKGINFTFPAGTAIGAGEYLVIARDPERIRAVYGLPAEKVLGPAQDQQSLEDFGALSNEGERLTLKDALGNTADAVRAFDGGEWPHWADGGGSSLELIDPFSDNDAGQAWDASDDSGKADAQIYSYTGRYLGGEPELQFALAGPGKALIDDVAITAGATNHVTNGAFEADARGWMLQGTHVHSARTTENPISGAGSLLIISTAGGDNKVNRIETPDASGLGLGALNTTTTYTISFKARWVVGSPALLTRGYNHAYPRSHRLAVPANLGTPGAPNSATLRRIARAGSADAGPVLSRLEQSPAVPGDREVVKVSIRAFDADGVSEVRLFYAAGNPPDGSGSSVALADADGAGNYTGSIPGFPMNTRVVFFVEARDAGGRVGRYPADDAARAHPFLADPAAAASVDRRYCIYRHAVRNPATSFHSYRFWMHQANEEYLSSRPLHSNDPVDGAFVLRGTSIFHNSRIRFAGSPWARGGWGGSYRIRLPDDGGVPDRFASFNLENHATDARERISHYLIRYNQGAARVPYSDQWFALFQVNDRFAGNREHVWTPNRKFLELWWGEDSNGDFFELDDRFELNDGGAMVSSQDARLLYPPYSGSGSDKENYRYYFNLRAKEGNDDYASLISLAQVMTPSRTSNSQFDALVWNQLEVEEVLRVLSIRLNIDDWDTWGARRGKNAYLYRPEAAGRWIFIPWDLELTYGDPSAFSMPANPTSTWGNNFPEVERLLNRPRIKRLYYGILKEMVDHHFRSSHLQPFMQRLAAIGAGGTEVGQPGGWIDQRAQKIRGWIQPVVYPQVHLAITTNNGEPMAVPGDRASLAGSAPVEVMGLEVRVNGAPVPDLAIAFSNTSLTGWSAADLPLKPGANTVEVFGFDGLGNFIESDSIDIDAVLDWGPPRLDSIIPAAGVAGDPVVLLGAGFHGRLAVLFGPMPAAELVFEEKMRPNQILATVPEGLAAGAAPVKVRNLDGQESNALPFQALPSATRFLRGDANGDRAVDLADAVRILIHLFKSPVGACRDALDADDSGALDPTDAIRLLEYLFLHGAPPAAPFPACGGDPTTSDPLDCAMGLAGC
ncbi:MAG: lamin tail domain-containing protein [Planctomycetes bacterium]|nr:lamin tail domain-containing protein [Planctomycetota bacterium]